MRQQCLAVDGKQLLARKVANQVYAKRPQRLIPGEKVLLLVGHRCHFSVREVEDERVARIHVWRDGAIISKSLWRGMFLTASIESLFLRSEQTGNWTDPQISAALIHRQTGKLTNPWFSAEALPHFSFTS